MVLRELFVRLGLSSDGASFAEGFATVELLKKGLEVVSEKAREAREWIKEQVAATAEAGVEARRLGQSVGLSAGNFQRLAYAANLSEVSTDSLVGAMRRLGGQYGIGDMQKRILGLADEFQKLPDGAQKLYRARQYFGRGGAELIPLLNKGSAGIRDLMAAAEETGAVMDGEGIEAAEAYTEAQKRLGFSLTGLRNTVIVPLLVPLSHLVEWMAKGVVQFRLWYSTHLPQLIKALKLVGVAIASVIGAIVGLELAAFLGSVGLSGLTLGLAAAAFAAWEAFAAFVAAAAPVVGITLLIAAFILAVQDLYTFFQGGDSLIGRALKKWIGPFTDWRDAVHKVIEEVKQDFRDLFSLKTLGIGGQTAKQQREAGAAWMQDTPAQAWIKNLIPHMVMDPTAGGLIGGGAASPSAAAGRGGNILAPNFKATFHIDARGQDGEALAAVASGHLDEWWDNKMRESAGAL